MTSAPTPPVPDSDLLAHLRVDLHAAGFTVDGVEERLGTVAARALRRDHALPAARALAGDDPLAVIVRLFCLNHAIDTDVVERALPTVGVAGLVGLGLVAAEGAAVRATCDLRPHACDSAGWWLASDLPESAVGGPLPQDHVLGIGGASTTLATWTPRLPVARALDVGTGCGVQSLHLSQHAEHVVATDLSARALGYAAFNAALNGTSWELRAGSMLEPVAGETFDLIVSNPPFVITPRAAGVPLYEYRDGGRSGDAVVADLVRRVGAHLAPGGIAQLLGNWEIVGDDEDAWRTKVASWVEGTGLDAWVVQRETQDPAEYAETWVRDGGQQPGTRAHEQLYGAWLDDFASRGVSAIGFGIITVQRPDRERATFVDLVEVTGPVAQPMGPAVLAGLRARTWLAERTDDEVLDTAWRCADDVTEERHSRPGDTDPSVIVIRQGGGLRRAIRVDTLGAALLSVCDGELTARQAIVAIAGLLDLDASVGLADGVTLVRDLSADGLLLAN
ncbi:DUF7059 domain-containing protein [Janibacter sp. G1551]|uniref:DUF7059 domain-containing protein n=1 Tax=Janibacter sp. G1551 TaxID=3420440 RepID=UPI003D062D68